MLTPIYKITLYTALLFICSIISCAGHKEPHRALLDLESIRRERDTIDESESHVFTRKATLKTSIENIIVGCSKVDVPIFFQLGLYAKQIGEKIPTATDLGKIRSLEEDCHTIIAFNQYLRNAFERVNRLPNGQLKTIVKEIMYYIINHEITSIKEQNVLLDKTNLNNIRMALDTDLVVRSCLDAISVEFPE